MKLPQLTGISTNPEGNPDAAGSDLTRGMTMNSKNKRLNLSKFFKASCLCTWLGVCLWTVPAANANWEVSQELGAGIGHDDNVDLGNTVGSPDSETYYGVNASATFSYATPRSNFEITPALSSKRFADNSELNSDDLFMLVDYSRAGTKADFRFRGDISREAVRTAERLLVDFDVQELEDIDTDSSGVIVGTGDRERVYLSPQFLYKMSPRYFVALNGTYQDTSYDERAGTFLTGFKQYSVGGALLYNWTEKDVIRLDARASNYEADTVGEDARGSQFGIGYDRQLTERTQLRMLLATNNTEDRNGKTQSNPAGELSIVHRALLTNAYASYRQTVTGSGAGNQSVYNTFNLYLSRELSPKLSLGIGANAYTSDPLEDNIQEIDFSQVSASASWRVRRTVTLQLQYAFTHTKTTLGNDINNEDSNEISLWVYWSPNPLSR